VDVTRLVTLADVPALTRLVRDNRDFLAPWEPARGDAYYSADGQRCLVEAALAGYAAGTRLPCVILDESGQVAGRINLNEIVRGAFQSAHLGYWLSAGAGGRGLATAAVRELTGIAFARLALHRIEAGTLVHNVRSQRVLERNGFTRFGVAPEYLSIGGRWQDHILYQLINPERAA
jgi:[ribosomal protein S5]-alanine N-acetyltransferase